MLTQETDSMVTPQRLGVVLTLVVTVAFFWFFLQIPTVARDIVPTLQLTWVPFLNIEFILRLDGLGLLFALMITGVGILICIYSLAYMRKEAETRRYWIHLGLFTMSMLGTVLAGDLITFYVFWEMTTVTSFLLIGFNRACVKTRFAAWQALLITTAGGFTMLAGLTLLPVVTGSYNIEALLGMGDMVRGHDLYPVLLGLILAGAFSKSCQAPVHFWLPGAMVAPTPVSAYLHSATMVQAGVYLLARLHPVFGGTPTWSTTLAVVGGATALIGAVLALRQTDMKLVLAYSTVMALGTSVLLLSGNGEAPVIAVMTFLVVHALYKSALFLVAGSIEHQAGTRDLTRLGGLRRAMPLTALAATGAALSMAGLPPFAGFLGKEGLYAAALTMDWSILIALVMLLATALVTALAGIVAIGPFFGPASEKETFEAPVLLWIGPVLLAALGLIIGLFPGVIEPLVGPAATAVLGRPVTIHLSLWHGFSVPLALGGLTLLLGGAFYLLRARLGFSVPLDGGRIFHGLIFGLLHFATWLGHRVQTGVLRHYFLVVFVAAGSLLVGAIIAHDAWPAVPDWPELHIEEWVISIITIIAAVTVAVTHLRLLAICALGVAGANVALLFVIYGAPDVAITQLMVEILIVVILTQVMLRLPRFDVTRALVREQRIGHLVVAILAGCVMTVLLLSATSGGLDPKLGEYFIAHALTEGYGRNVVNVILVDFRGLDTLGEITVLGIAGMAGYALVKVRWDRIYRGRKK